MSSDKSHKQQHHLPKTYLKPWAFEVNGRSAWVDTYSPNGAYIGEYTTANILKQEDMYTIHLPDGSRDLKWEFWLNRCETDYTGARERVISTKHVFDTDLKPIRLFIAAQRNRALYIVNRHKDLQQITDDLGEAYGFRPKMLASGYIVSAEEAAASTGNIITDTVMPEIHRMAKLMEGMHASVILTKEAGGFWTCDNPVIMADGSGQSHFNIFASDAKIFLPISPTICVRLSWKQMGRSLFSESELHSFNEAIQRQAYQLMVRNRVGAAQPKRSTEKRPLATEAFPRPPKPRTP